MAAAPPTPGWFHDFAWTTVKTLAALTIDFHIEGASHIPADGPYLLVGNHISHFDPPLISVAMPRRVTWVVALDLFANPVIAAIFRGIKSIPVNREKVDKNATRAIIEVLRAGRPAGLFPEGGIRQSAGSLLVDAALDESVVSLAQIGRAPILPVSILGADKLYVPGAWHPGATQVCIEFCPLVDTSGRGASDRAAVAEEVTRSMREAAARAVRRFGWGPRDMPATAQERWNEAAGRGPV